MQYINENKLGNEKIGRYMDKLLKLAYPFSPYCLVCDAIIPLENDYGICNGCMKKFGWGHINIHASDRLREIQKRSFLDSAISCTTYGMYERKLISRLKFGRKTYYARTIGKIMADRVLSDDEMAEIYLKVDYLIPVPIHEKKLNERGFNQCNLIAKFFRQKMPEMFEFELKNDALFRNRETPPMKNISGYERYVNLEEAFTLNEEIEIKGKSVILLDDVYTTGSTAEHCAIALKEAGAKEVHFISYAVRSSDITGVENEKEPKLEKYRIGEESIFLQESRNMNK